MTRFSEPALVARTSGKRGRPFSASGPRAFFDPTEPVPHSHPAAVPAGTARYAGRFPDGGRRGRNRHPLPTNPRGRRGSNGAVSTAGPRPVPSPSI